MALLPVSEVSYHIICEWEELTSSIYISCQKKKRRKRERCRDGLTHFCKSQGTSPSLLQWWHSFVRGNFFDGFILEFRVNSKIGI